MSHRISFVVAARNDDYGGKFLHRMGTSMNVLAVLCKRHQLDFELVIVEWNPPATKPRLKDAIKWPRDFQSGTVRVIEVSADVHHALPDSDKMPLFEYIAKNVGIRRARGSYVLVTNPDIIFGDKVIKYLQRAILSPDRFYRADRYDVSDDIPENLPVDQQLEFCSAHAFRIQMETGTLPARRIGRLKLWATRNVPRVSPYRVARGLARRSKALFPSRNTIGHEQSCLPPVHTNCSGDFFLMAAKRWHSLRGYPELKTHSHIDSYLCYLAIFSGLKQTVVPFPIYHQEHDRSDQRTRPLTVLNELPLFKDMVVTGQPRNSNNSNWGLGGENLSVFEL
jgi:hypothetical protein